jgi:hypothetical protein
MGMRPRGWLTTLGVVGFVLGTACGGESVAAKQMQQLKAAYSSPSPVSPAMPDHIFLAQGDGTFLFLHFDKPVDKAEKVLYTGMAVPGVFSRADQERVEKQFGKGFTHFHRAKCAANDANACHGADRVGEEGFWFRHVAVDNFKMPWGDVRRGTDYNFMPTPPPN